MTVFKGTRRNTTAVLGIFIFLGGTCVGRAQSAPAPVGVWGSNSGETMIIQPNGCQISANGVVGAVGTCSWNPSARGGILTIINTNAYQPAPVYFNIVWVDTSTITIFGDVFHRQQ